MKLYYSTATAATPVHIALEEAGASYERLEVSWSRDLNVAELERLNPLGAAPVLVTDDGEVLTQSVAILEFVADTHPQAGLLAEKGTVERARTLAWASFAAADLLRAFTPLVQAEAMTSSAAAQAELKTFALEAIHPLLAHVDAHVAGKPYVMGQRFTIADPYLFFVVSLAGWLGVRLDGHANLGGYLARVAARPATRRILALEDLLD
jgi:glutathione S-transferase